MIIGTAHFKDMASAVRYYGQQSIDYDGVKQKISDGSIFIGKPTAKPGDAVKLNHEGRYEIHEGAASAEAEEPGIAISTDVIAILAAATVDGNKLKLSGQLDRKDYSRVNKILETIGGKWSKKDGAHVFKEDVGDMIEDIIATGAYRNVKKDFQQYDTPENLAERVVDLADIKPEMLVLEPSAGLGVIALAAAAKGALVDMYEIDQNRYEHLINLNIRLSGVAKPQDFLTAEPSPIYDRVTMNPPFNRAQDIAHVTHALRFLKPGGTLVSIMSPGVKFRQGKKYDEFRALMDAHDGEIFDVDEGTFKESGTQIRTVIVRMRA